MTFEPQPPVDVPADETPTARCSYCDRPFKSTRARDLHIGEHHIEVATSQELETLETARSTERDELFFYHIKVVVALALIYSALVIGYMAVLGSGAT